MACGMEPLKIRLEEFTKGVVAVYASGPLNMRTALNFRTVLWNVLSQCPKKVAVHLQEVKRVDTAGIAVLVECTRWGLKKDIEFVVVDLSETVEHLLELCCVKNLIPVLRSEYTQRDEGEVLDLAFA